VPGPLRLEPDWKKAVAFLLHGYNVEPSKAAPDFDRLLRAIERVPPPLPTLLDTQSWAVYWQGYTSAGLAGGKTLLSPLHYADQIPSAREAAHALYHYLNNNAPDKTPVTLVAHSLGCRVALELLDLYAISSEENRPTFPLAVLMAAAVPTYFFEDLSRLWRGALLPDRVLVFFSSRDIVLQAAFRAGQTIAGEGFFPKAVGATGAPQGFWRHAVRTRNGHSGYFDDILTSAEIARALGKPVPVNLPTFDGGSGRPDAAPAALPTLGLPAIFPVGQR
jgi:pimeloyl-ACP methyl ester carboxylesterase